MVTRTALASFVGAAVIAITVGCGAAAADDVFHDHSETSSYTVDITYPLDYPDAAAVADFVAADRQEFVDWVADIGPDGRNRPYTYDVSAKTYRSARPATQSLVLTIDNDTGAVHQDHPETSFRTFTFDLTKRTPVTFGTLFKPEGKPLDVLTPIVRRELHAPTLELLPSDFRNFAVTDDAVVFFFGEGQLIPGENNGPHQISVPRSELAPLMA